MLTKRVKWTPLQGIGSDKLKTEQQPVCDVILAILYTQSRSLQSKTENARPTD
jgi:hypothetical protein